MSFKDNDFIEIEYDAWDAGSDTLIATTSESRAKESNIYDSKAKYGKVLVVIGSNGIIKGLDREIRKMNVGESKKSLSLKLIQLPLCVKLPLHYAT